MNGEIVACMGGWCPHRNHCAHHYSDSPVIAERLCPKGAPQPLEFMPRQAERQDSEVEHAA